MTQRPLPNSRLKIDLVRPGMLAHTCNPTYWEAEIGRIMV
jgi:hypothetical protein